MKQDNFFKLTLLKRRGAQGLTGKKRLITTDSLTDWLQDLLTGCLIDWPADWVTDWLADRLLDCLIVSCTPGLLGSWLAITSLFNCLFTLPQKHSCQNWRWIILRPYYFTFLRLASYFACDPGFVTKSQNDEKNEWLTDKLKLTWSCVSDLPFLFLQVLVTQLHQVERQIQANENSLREEKEKRRKYYVCINSLWILASTLCLMATIPGAVNACALSSTHVRE